LKKQLPIIDTGHKAFISKENLPYPFVHYPGISGPFIGFSTEEEGEIYFCDCFRITFEKYFLMQEHRNYTFSDPMDDYILSAKHFPYDYVKSLIQSGVASDRQAVNCKIHFKKNLCHKCNSISPSYRVNFCNVSTFERQHAWYVRKRLIDIGIELPEIYRDSIPNEYLSLLKIIWDLDEKGVSAAQNGKYSESSAYYNEASCKYTVFHRLVENEVREAFNYPLIGEHWQEETKLYKIIQSILPQNTIERHYRPVWLERLELDFFLPEIPLGIEYQGIQHYCPIKHWGGEKGLEIRKEHDRRKLNLATENNIPIVYFNYKDLLTFDLVYERISPYFQGCFRMPCSAWHRSS
jgi:hypothetical protein